MKFIIALVLFFSLNAHAYTEYRYKVHRVVDGDTISFYMPWLPKELGSVAAIRLDGVDTPEKSEFAKCKSESELGIKASDFTTNFMKNKTAMISLKRWDKFGGRIIGDVKVGGRDLASELITAGLAKPYDGRTKPNWCN